MAGVFERNQLSTRRVAMALERLDIDAESFAAEYEAVRVPRSRKNRLSKLSVSQIESLRELLVDRTPEREAEVMSDLGIKTRTTLDRTLADFAASLIS